MLTSLGSLDTRQAEAMALWTGRSELNSRRTNLEDEMREWQWRVKLGRRIGEENWETETLAVGDAGFFVALSAARIMLEVDLPALAQFAISNPLFFHSFFNPKTSLKPQQSTPLSVDDGVGFWASIFWASQFHKAHNNLESHPLLFA